MKKIRNIIFILSLTLCSSLFISCNMEETNEEMNTIVDMEGTTVKLSNNINRVACISPSMTDLMIAFGAGDKIVGTYRSFMDNPLAKKIYPRSNEFKSYSYSVSAEELINDNIDLIFLQNTENIESLRNAGLSVVAVHQYSSNGTFDEDIYSAAKILGDIFGGTIKEKADYWINEVHSTIDDIKNVIGKDNSDKSIYYVNGEKKKGLYYSDGGNSMISSILNIANVKLATEKYNVLNVHKVSEEEMIRLNPHAILIGGIYQNELLKELDESSIWSLLDCKKNDRVYRIPVVMVSIENVCAETPVMLRYISNIFNPNFEFDFHSELKANVIKYFNYSLSNNEIDLILKCEFN